MNLPERKKNLKMRLDLDEEAIKLK